MTAHGCRRIAVLWEHVTGYLQAALRALLEGRDTRLLVVQNAGEENARFDAFLHERSRFIDLRDASDVDLVDELCAFDPDLALITGNRHPPYLRAARFVHRQGGLVVWANDRVLRVPLHDLAQVVAGRGARLWRHFDAAFVPGHAATRYARAIGFPGSRIFQGLYTCDTALYRPVGLVRHEASDSEWPRAFLYLGQLIERKGVDILVDAYQRYRVLVPDPWDLWCIGEGPQQPVLAGCAGVTTLGFLPPDECARAMAQVGALVVPSRWDHWGVVIHEGTCAGLPVVASYECGASHELIQDGHNGYIVPAGDPARLAHALAACSDVGRARKMGANSLQVSYRFSPELFAWQLLENIPSAIR